MAFWRLGSHYRELISGQSGGPLRWWRVRIISDRPNLWLKSRSVYSATQRLVAVSGEGLEQNETAVFMRQLSRCYVVLEDLASQRLVAEFGECFEDTASVERDGQLLSIDVLTEDFAL
jgi:hypothetical protein